MKSTLKGKCNCGGVTYQVSGEPLLTYVCHCGNCRRRSGSAFGMGLVVSTENLEVVGELDCWERVSEIGNKNPVYRCATCGNVIYGLGAYTPGLAKLMPGTLTDTVEVEPDVHIWTSSAQKWVSIPLDVLQYAEQPEDFGEVLRLAAENRRSSEAGS
jgi:hypothetical protein